MHYEDLANLMFGGIHVSEGLNEARVTSDFDDGTAPTPVLLRRNRFPACITVALLWAVIFGSCFVLWISQDRSLSLARSLGQFLLGDDNGAKSQPANTETEWLVFRDQLTNSIKAMSDALSERETELRVLSERTDRLFDQIQALDLKLDLFKARGAPVEKRDHNRRP